MIPRRSLETLSVGGRIFAIITALAIITITPYSVLAQDSSSAIQQLKKHLNEAYTAAQNNDTAGVLVALDEANRILFFLELSTVNMADNNMTNKTTATITIPTTNPQTNNTDTNLLTWENPTHGIKIKYPSSWEKQEEEAGTMTTTLVNFLSPPQSSTDEFPETLNIGVEDLPTQSFTLEQYSKLGINKLRTSLQDVNIIESTDATLAGNPAHKITYTFTFIDADNPSIQLPLKNMQIWTVNNGKAYVITYGGVVNQFSESLADAQKIIDSFEILSRALTQPSTTPFNAASTTLNTTTAAPATNITSSNFLTYQSELFPFKIDYPADWEKEESPNGVRLVSPPEKANDKFGETLDIYNSPSAGVTAKDLADITINNLKTQYNDFQVVESNSSKVAGNDAYIIVYTFTDPTFGLTKAMDTIVTSQNNDFLISYSAEPDHYSFHLPTVMKMIDSFEIIDSKTNTTTATKEAGTVADNSTATNAMPEITAEANIG